MLDFIPTIIMGALIILGTTLMRRLAIERTKLLVLYNAKSRILTPNINEYQLTGDLDINPDITATA